jgi:predicted nuclease of restriction endonuclease-like (RecB) superfamily
VSLVVNDFEGLAQAITQAHEHLLTQAARPINVNLTLRNWLIGGYIYEYEQDGTDRAAYGERLLDHLAERLTVNGLRNCSGRELRRYRQFYLTYPQIRESLPHESIQLLPGQLRGALIRGTASPELTQPGVTLIANLSFSHLAELMQIDGPLKRTFYEIESLRGRWSVRELKRQIASLYYERSHLSHDRQKLAELARASADQATPAQIIRDPYIFEFLGLQPQEVMSESALENALLDKLHDFLLEVGRGFCFEARQSAFSSATNIFPSIWSSITAFSNVTS